MGFKPQDKRRSPKNSLNLSHIPSGANPAIPQVAANHWLEIMKSSIIYQLLISNINQLQPAIWVNYNNSLT
jgi:hypothetical protein